MKHFLVEDIFNNIILVFFKLRLVYVLKILSHETIDEPSSKNKAKLVLNPIKSIFLKKSQLKKCFDQFKRISSIFFAYFYLYLIVE